LVTLGSGFDSRLRIPYLGRDTYQETPIPAAGPGPNYRTTMSDDNMTAAEYRTEIKNCAEIAIGETIQYFDHSIDSDAFEEELDREVWETADGHQWMIYTGYHMDVLRHADHEPEEWENYVNLRESPSYRDVIQAMAFDVFYRDLYRAAFNQLEELRESREEAR
jgi:hypothetical protein